MKKKSEKHINSKWTKIYVTEVTKNLFKKYCKDQKIEMQEAANDILLFIVKNKIPLNAIEEMMDKNITKQVIRYHNYNAGFLQEFEKKQLELMKKLTAIVAGNGAGEDMILKVFSEEILRGVQFLVFQNSNKDLAQKILDMNEININKVLDDNKG